MGKRRGLKKNRKGKTNGWSNSSLWKVEAEAGAGQSQCQTQKLNVKEASMNNLPPEMLTAILKCVDTLSLFKCRLVDRQWNDISSGILRQRRDAQIRFEYDDTNEFVKLHNKNFENKRTLCDFLKCMKASKNCPFSHFGFSITNREPSVLSNFFEVTDFKEFLSDFSSSLDKNPNQSIENKTSTKIIKGLELSFFCLEDSDTVHKLAGNLGDLLSNKIPRLEEFSFDIVHFDVDTQFKLFSKETDKEKNAVPVQFKLPHLKSIRFEANMISAHPQFAKDLLSAAVNLKKLNVRSESVEDFEILHSLGKLHLVKEAFIYTMKNFFSPIQIQQQQEQQQQQQQRLNFPPLPQLQTLELRLDISEFDQITHALASNFLGNLFESSKNTLITFKLRSWTCGFACLPGFQLPNFKYLKELRVSVDYDAKYKVFPPGSKSKDIFPAVVSLDLEQVDVQKESMPIFPRLKTFCMKDRECTETAISLLAFMSPNLKKLQIKKSEERPLLFNFLHVGRLIWTHLKQLESLEVDVNLDDEENNPSALDSCFTGISLENCKRLFQGKPSKCRKLQCKNTKQKLMTQREHPSILDMTKLKTLIINPYSDGKFLRKTEFFTEKLTWISEEYAFNLMPHLKPKATPEKEDSLKCIIFK